MATDIKHTQLTRVGYIYQDYVCIEKLVEWYRDPAKYQWIAIEGTETEDGKFKSLDDVVALNSDGAYELYQVKFTTDADNEDNALSFKWLTKHKPKGTSLLQKWNVDVEKYGALGKLSIASLKTNRKPDEEFASCLNGDKLNISGIPADILSKIDAQLGGRDATVKFFSQFSFEHSLRKIDTLEQDLESKLVPDHTSSEGWLKLLKAVQYWATRKKQPDHDGKITLAHLQQIISHKNHSTLSQFFEIPEGYTPPSEDFHKEIIESTKNTGPFVISGLPGTGKSTYLSYLTEELLTNKRPVIRHHYSIDSHGLSDRITFSNAACSLLSQLKQLVPQIGFSEELKPDELEKKIASAAELLANEEKSCLTIIIDGLDHVARERSDISQLEHMINRLLELSDKVCIIFGTQPVSDEQLPSKLIAKCPCEKWLTLPYMDLSSIKSWLDVQIDNGVVDIRGEEDNRDREVSEISEALLKISSGYPLHLIYSIKTLTAQDKTVSSYEVERLPVCSDGDIQTYYDTLWSNLSASAREVMVLIACVHFQWPKLESLKFCVDQTDFYKSFDEIRHLVEIRRSGIFAFHGSVLVYVRNQEIYEQAKPDCMKRVCTWLDERAPDFWKWGWTWVAQAEVGNVQPIFDGISYDWSVDALRKGYPLDHIEHVISFAEAVAFERKEFKTLSTLRHIRFRVVNGTQFQLQDYSEFLECALKVNQDSYCIFWRVDNLRTLDDSEIAVIASISKNIDQSIIDDCFNEVARRLDFYAQFQDRDSNDKLGSLIHAAITILASYEEPPLDVFFGFLDRLGDKSRYFNLFIEELIRLGSDFIILDIPEEKVPEGAEYSYWDGYFKACCGEGVAFFDRCPEKKQFSSPFIELSRMLDEGVSGDFSYPAPKVGDLDFVSEDYFRNFFFHCLFISEDEKNEEITEDDLPYSLESVDDAEYVTKYLAQEYRKEIKGNTIHPLFLMKLFQGLNVRQSTSPHYRERQNWVALKSALSLISAEICPILKNKNKLDEGVLVQENDVVDSWDSPYSLLRHFSDCDISILPQQSVVYLFDREYEKLKSKREGTNELCQEGLDLSKYAMAFGLLDQASEYLKFSARNAFGYGWRKDTTLSELFDALDACSEAGIGELPNWLEKIAPFVDSIFDFSEREIRHIPGWFLELVAKHIPERMVDEIKYNISQQNWWIAQSALEHWVTHADIKSVSDQNFIKCMTSYSALEALKVRAEKDVSLQSLLDEQVHYLGGFPPAPRELGNSPNFEKDLEGLNFNDYPPQDLEKLDQELLKRKIISRGDVIEEWITYWNEKGQGVELINVFEQQWQKNCCSPYNYSKCLDEIFEISLKLNGKKKSRQWAVRSIQSNGYWNRWHHADAKLKRYAEVYAEDWEGFLVETTQSNKVDRLSKGWIAAPRDALVKYLIAAKQFDLASDITAAMLESVEEEIKYLPLPKLYWRNKPYPREETSARAMLEYYNWPDRYARMRTANQIAHTLDHDSSFKKIFLEHLSQQVYEIEVTDLLSILLLTESCQFTEEELRSAINAPSILSGYILGKLGFSVTSSDVHGYHSALKVDGTYQSEKFEKAKNGIAPIHAHSIQGIGKELDYPLLQHMKAEWDEISKRREFLFFNPHNFSSDYFYPKDLISCNFSTSAEIVHLSAYLRTLAFAVDELDFPYDEAMSYSTAVQPFGGVCSSLIPANPPLNWPEWNNVTEDNKQPDADDLTQWLKDLSISDQSILFANGPVCRNAKELHCDLEVMKVHIAGHVSKDAKEIFSLVEREKAPNGISPYFKKVFVPEMGRWEVAWYLRGFAVPEMAFANFGNGIDVRDDDVVFISAGMEIASWGYWAHHWYPVWYRGLGSNFGTCLIANDEVAMFIAEDDHGADYLVGKLKIEDKRNFRRDDPTIELYAMIKLEG